MLNPLDICSRIERHRVPRGEKRKFLSFFVLARGVTRESGMMRAGVDEFDKFRTQDMKTSALPPHITPLNPQLALRS